MVNGQSFAACLNKVGVEARGLRRMKCTQNSIRVKGSNTSDILLISRAEVVTSIMFNCMDTGSIKIAEDFQAIVTPRTWSW
jgi:hypothetical protein